MHDQGQGEQESVVVKRPHRVRRDARVVAPPMAPKKISHCCDGTFPKDAMTASKSPSLSVERLWDIQ